MKQPNFTQVPNEIIDLMPQLSGSEFKVLVAICRKTIGWHKTHDAISLSQLHTMTGLESSPCVEALKKLETLGLIVVNRCPGKTNTIDLVFETSSESEEHLFKKCIGTSSKSEDTKESEINKKQTLQPPSAPASLPTKAEKKERVVKSITDYYQKLFVDEYGAKPAWDGKIIKLVKADIARLGDSMLGSLIQIFFENPTSFVTKQETGMGYNIFHSQIDALLEKRRRAG
jgi:phage replication O-like protein O